jgi:hypothetical protein
VSTADARQLDAAGVTWEPLPGGRIQLRGPDGAVRIAGTEIKSRAGRMANHVRNPRLGLAFPCVVSTPPPARRGLCACCGLPLEGLYSDGDCWLCVAALHKARGEAAGA